MPDAFSAAFGGSSSSCERSRPRLGPAVFLTAVLDFLGAARAGSEASSWAARASRSAFLRAASAFLAASASLSELNRGQQYCNCHVPVWCMSLSASLFLSPGVCVCVWSPDLSETRAGGVMVS